MREQIITPNEFLQKIANIDNRIMRANSEELIFNENFEDTIESSSESESDTDDDPSNCIVCNKNKIEVLLIPCAHLCCCKKCWEIQKSITDSKGRPICPLCKTGVKKFTFVEI